MITPSILAALLAAPILLPSAAPTPHGPVPCVALEATRLAGLSRMDARLYLKQRYGAFAPASTRDQFLVHVGEYGLLAVGYFREKPLELELRLGGPSSLSSPIPASALDCVGLPRESPGQEAFGGPSRPEGIRWPNGIGSFTRVEITNTLLSGWPTTVFRLRVATEAEYRDWEQSRPKR